MAEKVEDTITDYQKHRIGIISATTPQILELYDISAVPSIVDRLCICDIL